MGIYQAMTRLHRVDCSDPGVCRIRCGRGFRYLDENGESIRDPATLERFRSLAIPPAWRDVWVCPDPSGHIQSTGYDDAGRKQYLYHPRWRERQDQRKFEHVLEFAAALPRLRRRLARALERRGLVRERVLACGVRLLDLGFFRIGNEQYAEENETYGVATLRRRHVTLEGGAAVFDYRGKGGQRHRQEIADALVLPTIRSLKRRQGGGHRLLAYRNGQRWSNVRAEELNDYLAEEAAGDYSASAFRTWNATVLAAVVLTRHDGPPDSKAGRKRAITDAVKDVAEYLSNTPAVCRRSYIDPRVFDRFRGGETIRERLESLSGRTRADDFPDRERIEAAVLELIGG
jgi:DNA topoisomerase-1